MLEDKYGKAEHGGIIQWLGAIPRATLLERAAQAHVGLALMPLRSNDINMRHMAGASNKAFDYMAAGRPVILAIDGVIREVVEQAQGGIFAQPGNPQAMAEAVLYLTNLPDRGRQIGMNARKHVEAQFDRSVLADTLADLFQQLLTGSIGQ